MRIGPSLLREENSIILVISAEFTCSPEKSLSSYSPAYTHFNANFSCLHCSSCPSLSYNPNNDWLEREHRFEFLASVWPRLECYYTAQLLDDWVEPNIQVKFLSLSRFVCLYSTGVTFSTNIHMLWNTSLRDCI